MPFQTSAVLSIAALFVTGDDHAEMIQVIEDYLDSTTLDAAEDIEAYVLEVYSESFLSKLPLEMHVRMHKMMGFAKGGLSQVELLKVTATSAQVLVATGGGDRFALSLAIESVEEPLITQLGLSEPPRNQAAEVVVAGTFAFPETAPGRLLEQWYVAYQRRDPRAIETFIRETFDPAYVEGKGLKNLVDLHDRMSFMGGDLPPARLLVSTDTEIKVLADDGHDGLEITLLVKGERIQGIGVILRRTEGAAVRPRARTDSEFEKRLIAEVEASAREEAFSGALLVARGESVLISRAWGEADKGGGVANELDTRFNLASMGKMFTAVGVGMLVEDGVLSWDMTLKEALPGFPFAQVAERVTLAHLLTHTSGLRPGLMATLRRQYPQRALKSHEDWLSYLRAEHFERDPGESFRYSNIGYLLLGRILEAHSGNSYPEFVEENVFETSGMDRSGFPSVDQLGANDAIGYRRPLGEGARWQGNEGELFYRGNAAGGAYATVGDLWRFANALLAGDLVSDACLAKLTSTGNTKGTSPGYGMGFALRSPGDKVQSFGHDGGFVGVSTSMRVYPKIDVVAVVLSNQDNGAPSIMEAIEQMVPLN